MASVLRRSRILLGSSRSVAFEINRPEAQLEMMSDSAWNAAIHAKASGDSWIAEWIRALRESALVATMSRSVVEILFLALGILNTFSTSFGQTIFFRNWTNCSSKAKRPFDTECPRIYMVTRPDSGETRNILTIKPTVFSAKRIQWVTVCSRQRPDVKGIGIWKPTLGQSHLHHWDDAKMLE